MSKKVQATMKTTKFKDCQIVAACSGENEEPVGIYIYIYTKVNYVLD
jgi:hypothetical protein